MPGFINSEDCFGGIIHAYFTQLIFSKIRKIKFVLVSHYTDLERTAINFAKAFEQFLVNFANHSQIIDELCESVSLLVNCVPKTVS